MCYSMTNFISINIKYIMPVCKHQVKIEKKEYACRVKLKITLQFRKQTHVLII